MDLETTILNELTDLMTKEIDYQLLADALGWTKVELPPFDSRFNAVDIADWCKDNCTGKFINFGIKFAFEKAKDAEWFILRWK